MASQIDNSASIAQPLMGAPKDKVSHDAFAKITRNLTLDQETAHPLLEISADRKEVTCGSIMKNVSASPKRFDTANCVVAKESFRDGQHYWKVYVGSKPRWNLGIVSERAERNGRPIQTKSCTKGYWMIGYNEKNDKKKYGAFDTNLMPFDCDSKPKTIGVYLNYPGGEVTFYNADCPTNLSPLYSFYNANFEKAPVYPFFDTCYHDNDKNKEPLKIL